MEGNFSTSGFSDALVILGAAGIVIPAFARIRITPIIGFILIGLLVGPSGLGALASAHPWLHYVTISKPEAVTPFAELGIVLLLFSIGLELSFRRLWSMRRIVFGVGAAELVGGAVIIAAGLHAMGQAIPGSIGLGLALALSSTAIVLPLVGSQSAVGRAALGMLLFEDLALVPIVFALGAMSPSATAGVGPLLGTLLLGGAVALGLLFGGRLLLPILFAQAARTKNPEVFLAACLLVVIVASMVTSAIGFSAVLGALIAGIVIAETEYRGEVEAITAPFRGLGLGIFLITVGMSVNLRQLVANWQTVLVALVAVLAVKALITAALLRLNGSRTGVAAETGVLMASPSETTLIVLGSATAAQLIQPETAAFWQIVTALGLTITPLARQARALRRAAHGPNGRGRARRRAAPGRPGQGGDRRLRAGRPDRRRHARAPRPRLCRDRRRHRCGANRPQPRTAGAVRRRRARHLGRAVEGRDAERGRADDGRSRPGQPPDQAAAGGVPGHPDHRPGARHRAGRDALQGRSEPGGARRRSRPRSRSPKRCSSISASPWAR